MNYSIGTSKLSIIKHEYLITYVHDLVILKILVAC